MENDSLLISLESFKSSSAKCTYLLESYQSALEEDEAYIWHLIIATSGEHHSDSCLMIAYRSKAIKHYQRYEIDSAKFSFLQSAHYASRHRDSIQEVSAYANVAFMHTLLGHQDSAIFLYKKVLENYEMLGEERYAANTYLNLGRQYGDLGMIAEAIPMYYKAIDIFNTYEDTIGLAYAYNNMGNLYNTIKDKDNAVSFLQEAYRLKLALGDPKDIGRALFNLSLPFHPMYEKDSINKYLQKSLEIAESLNDSIELAAIWNNLGVLATKHQQCQEAIPFLRRALAVRNGAENQYPKVQSLARLADAFAVCGLADSSIHYADMGISMASESALSLLLVDLYDVKTRSYILKGDQISAQQYLDLANNLRDSIFQQRTADISAVYAVQLGLRDKEQSLQMTQMDLSYAQKHRRNQALIFVLVILSLLGLILGLRKRLQYKNKLITQQQLISEADKRHEKKKYELSILQSILETQEDERRRIGKDLHDSIGSLLATVKLHVQALGMKNPGIQHHDNFNKVNAMLDSTHEEIRRISHDMAPETVMQLGIKEAIFDLVEFYTHDNIRLTTDLSAWHHTPTKREAIFLYRIIQELLQNALRHASASHIHIVIKDIGHGEYLCIVEDDGHGFDIRQESQGLGIKNIHDRLRYLRGSIKITSHASYGTRFEMKIPVSSSISEEHSEIN